jgi:hypothetical protein
LIDALAALRPLTGKRYNHTMQAFARRGLPWLSKGQVLARLRAVMRRRLSGV